MRGRVGVVFSWVACHLFGGIGNAQVSLKNSQRPLNDFRMNSKIRDCFADLRVVSTAIGLGFGLGLALGLGLGYALDL